MSDRYATICGVRYRSANKRVYAAKYHVIWCPKYRRRVIGGRVEIRLKETINEVVDGYGGQVIGLGTMPDHVHLLMEVPPTVALPGLIRKLKGDLHGRYAKSSRTCAGFRRCGRRRGSCPRPAARRWKSCAATSRTRNWPGKACRTAIGPIPSPHKPVGCSPTQATPGSSGIWRWSSSPTTAPQAGSARRRTLRPGSPQLAAARADNEWLAAGSSSVQQQALRDYDRAMVGFFRGSHRKPSWRKAGRDEGFCIRDVKAQKVNRRWGRVFVPKAGWLRFRLTRPLPVKLGMARVTLDAAGRWHVSFTAAQPAITRASTGSEVGIDRGVATALALSTGQHYQVPHSRKADRKVRKLAARMSRGKRGSKRRDGTKNALAMAHSRAAGRRKDWIEKTTTTLIREHDLIVVEDLRIKNMVRKPRQRCRC